MAGKTIRFLDDEEWPSSCLGFDLPLDRETTALCVIDMQNYCIDPAGDLVHSLKVHDEGLFASYRRRVELALDQTRALVAEFRRLGRRVIFTRHGSLLPDGSDLIERRRSREQVALAASERKSGHLAAAGTPGHQIDPRLEPLPGELVLDKNTSSAFNSTGIELLLRNMKVETLVVAGIASDMCVFTTALDAADRGFHVVIAEDACTTIDPGSREAAMLMFRRVWGLTIPTGAIVDWAAGRRELTRRPAAPASV